MIDERNNHQSTPIPHQCFDLEQIIPIYRDDTPRKIRDMTEQDETLFKFPCEFPLKIMGKNVAAFEPAVITIVRKHVPDLGEGAVRTRPSGKGNYLAITVTFEAHSREQLDNLYRELHACEHVSMLL
jgi:putative lipoic acid-binding regulatory protein